MEVLDKNAMTELAVAYIRGRVYNRPNQKGFVSVRETLSHYHGGPH